MYGYININKMQLRVSEFYEFRGFYCGLCETLGERYGISGRLSLTFDMTFLIILLTSLYEEESKITKKRCMVHPLSKSLVIKNKFSNYAADMNILLAYEHFRDDFKDEKRIKGLLGMAAYKSYYKKIITKYPRQVEVIRRELSKLTELEKENSEDVSLVSDTFGRIMSEIFIYEEDVWEESLRGIGFYLGKFIYIMDAYDDIEKDKKSSSYNPFIGICEMEGFKTSVLKMLEENMREAISFFERLPLIKDVEILRNILYDGVWNKFR